MTRILFSLMIVLSAAGSAMALEPLPKEKGWSGFVLFGGGFMKVEANTIAGNQIIDIGDETIDDIFASPDSDSSAVPTATFGLEYTFKNLKTQWFIGNDIEDYLRLDLVVAIGVRQKIGQSLLEAAIVRTPGVGREVWEDPYIAGSPRKETDWDATGIRLTWQTGGLEFLISAREIEIDNERSGLDGGLGLTPGEIALLDREGNINRFRTRYRFKPRGRHIFEPGIEFIDHDSDGEAKAYDGARLLFTYAFHGLPKWIWTTTVQAGSFENKEVNPIYGIQDEFDSVAINSTFTWDLFKSDRWKAIVIAAYADRDHDIDFYDSQIVSGSVGAIYRF